MRARCSAYIHGNAGHRGAHDLDRRRLVDRCRLVGVVAEETVDLFEVRVRDLAHVLADLDLGDDSPVLVLNGRQLVHAAEHGFGFGRDEPFADAEQVDLRALVEDVLDNILVERVRARDLAGLPSGLV